MWCQPLKYRRSTLSGLLLALLYFNSSYYSQAQITADSVYLTRPWKIINIPSPGSLITGKITQPIIPSMVLFDNRNTLFYDSLETKASRFLFTRKLYDLLVVSGSASSGGLISESSQQAFSPYSGKIIRNINIRRLDVFGTNINNPLTYDQQKQRSFSIKLISTPMNSLSGTTSYFHLATLYPRFFSATTKDF